MTTAGAVAAVDLGATSGRVIVGRVGADTLEMQQIARFPNGPVALADGLHWNVVGLYEAAVRGLKEAFRLDPSIASIGVDSWAVDYGLLRGDTLLGEPFHYRDARTERGVASVHAHTPHAELYTRNGLQFLPFNTLYQFAAEDADLLRFADTALLVPDLLNFWLSGVRAAERTNASTTGLLDPRTGEWDDDLVARVGVRRELLPALVSAGSILGTLRPAVATAIGAGDAVQVTAIGSHDTASAVVAVPMDPAHAVYISCGTWALVGVETRTPVLTPESLAANFTNEGGVDGRTRLLHNVMGLWILSEAQRTWERDGTSIDLPTLLASAAEVTTSVPVFDVDDERFLAPGDMPSRIDAWCHEHDVAPPRTRAEYARSIIESLAQAFADAAATAARLGGVDLRTIHIVGGGALNALLCQRTADRSGLPVLAGPVEATAIGNLLIQARALGFITGSLEDLRDLVARTHVPKRYDPRA